MGWSFSPDTRAAAEDGEAADHGEAAASEAGSEEEVELVKEDVEPAERWVRTNPLSVGRACRASAQPPPRCLRHVRRAPQDCDTIVSTYSNLENRPAVLGDRPVRQIRLGKSGAALSRQRHSLFASTSRVKASLTPRLNRCRGAGDRNADGVPFAACGIRTEHGWCRRSASPEASPGGSHRERDRGGKARTEGIAPSLLCSLLSALDAVA